MPWRPAEPTAPLRVRGGAYLRDRRHRSAHLIVEKSSTAATLLIVRRPGARHRSTLVIVPAGARHLIENRCGLDCQVRLHTESATYRTASIAGGLRLVLGHTSADRRRRWSPNYFPEWG